MLFLLFMKKKNFDYGASLIDEEENTNQSDIKDTHKENKNYKYNKELNAFDKYSYISRQLGVEEPTIK
jgi:hypothetical protein